MQTILGGNFSVDTLEHINLQMGRDADSFLKNLPKPDPKQEGPVLVATADCKGDPLIKKDAAKVAAFETAKKRPGNRRMAIGKIKHKDEIHVGEHAVIVPVKVFNRVQTNLKRNGQSGGTLVRNKHSALLKGLLYCQSCGCVMTHSFSCKGNKRYRNYVFGTAMQRGWSECPAPSVPAGEIERFVVEQIRTIGKDPALLNQTTIDVQQRTQVESIRLNDELKSLARQMQDVHTKLQAIVANPNIARNLSGLSEIQSRIETADRRSRQITSELTVLEAQKIDDQQITNVLSGFDDLGQTLPPKEQVRLVRLLVESVNFDGPRGNVAITFHPTGLKSLTENQLEHAQ